MQENKDMQLSTIFSVHFRMWHLPGLKSLPLVGKIPHFLFPCQHYYDDLSPHTHTLLHIIPTENTLMVKIVL